MDMASRWFSVFLLTALSVLAMGQSIPIPNSCGGVEGNSSSSYPFFSGFTVRYQQVYDASQFSAVTNGGWIYWLNFRPDGGTPSFGALVSNVEIHLSTTLRHPDGLSPLFSDNVGPDDATVFYGAVGLYSPAPSSPEGFGIGYNQAQLTNYFWYNPTAGNLLLDVRIHTLISPFYIIPPMDAATNQGVSSVYAAPVDATNGTIDTAGLVTLITIAPVPSLTACVSTNVFVLRWPAQPTTFILQKSSLLGSNAVWQSLPGVGGSNLVFKEYQIPLNSPGPPAFFRLARSPGH